MYVEQFTAPISYLRHWPLLMSWQFFKNRRNRDPRTQCSRQWWTTYIEWKQSCSLSQPPVTMTWTFICKQKSSLASSSSHLTGSNTSDSGPDTSQTCTIWGPITLKPGKNCKQATLQSRRMTFLSYPLGRTMRANIWTSSSLFGMHHQCVAPLAANI